MGFEFCHRFNNVVAAECEKKATQSALWPLSASSQPVVFSLSLNTLDDTMNSEWSIQFYNHKGTQCGYINEHFNLRSNI